MNNEFLKKKNRPQRQLEAVRNYTPYEE